MMSVYERSKRNKDTLILLIDKLYKKDIIDACEKRELLKEIYEE